MSTSLNETARILTINDVRLFFCNLNIIWKLKIKSYFNVIFSLKLKKWEYPKKISILLLKFFSLKIFNPLACLNPDQVVSFFILIKANNHTSNIYLEPIEKIHFTCNFDHDISETTKVTVEMPIKETSVENQFKTAIKIVIFFIWFEVNRSSTQNCLKPLAKNCLKK